MGNPDLIKKYFARVLIACLLGLLYLPASFGATANVSVNNDVFVPASTNISAGDRVIWTWPSGANNHNVTSTSTTPAWTASVTANGPFSFTNVFNSAGSFPYKCSVHVSLGMVGTITVAAANQPPTLAITNPTSGALFVAPANVTIQATVTNGTGSVTNVQFRVGATILTNDTAAPFSAATNNLPAGSYTLTAIAMDNLGLMATNSVSITVDAPPTVTITNPASGTVFVAPANVTIQASASDSDGTVTNVQFLIGATVLTNKTSAPYSAVTNNLAAGSYTLSTIASDNLGVKTTNSVNIIVDAPPSVTITNPVSGTVLSAPANVTIQASASDSDGTVTNVQFLIGATVLTNKNSAPFSAVTNNLAAGSYTLSAIASDNNGVKSTNAVTISVVTPVSTTLSGTTAITFSTNFQFSYSANVGLSYFIQRSTNLVSTNWITLVTNVAASNPVVFVDNHSTNSPGFYRVGRLPNP